jgi:hypothetical protein
MKRLAFAFLISLGVHILAYTLAFRTRPAEPDRSDEPLLSLYPEFVTLSATSPPGVSVRPARAGIGAAPGDGGREGSQEEGTREGRPVGPAGGGGSGRPETTHGGRFTPLAGPIARRPAGRSAAADSTARGRIKGWRSGWDFSGVRAPADAVGESMRIKSGLSDVFRPGAPPSKPEKNPVQFDFMPSEVQVHAMASVYKKDKATQKDLYLDLDSSAPMTASLFNRELEFLVSKGFLTRKKISPENLFTFMTPFGAMPVEMSRKNRLNPVYEYKAQVDRTKLLSFLQSHETQLSDRLLQSSRRDTAAVAGALRECRRSMAALVREN